MTQLIIIPPKENEGIYEVYAEDGEQVTSAMAFDQESAVIAIEVIAERKMWKQMFGEFRVRFVKDTNISEHELLIRAKEFHNKSTKRLCPECLN